MSKYYNESFPNAEQGVFVASRFAIPSYAVAQPSVIKEMNKTPQLSGRWISIVAATAAILDQDYAKVLWEHVKSEQTPS